MLQIVTKMYFRDGVELYSTLHREVLYTNCTFLREDSVTLPVGELAPSTGTGAISTATISVTEHLEAELPDGTRSIQVATGGTELIDDIADVLSIGLNAIFSPNVDLVRRLVPDTIGRPAGRDEPLFRRTFDPGRYVNDDERRKLRQFMTQLIGLRRKHFERAMRAIRHTVRATRRAAEDPTTAYIDLVAAIESLSEGAEVPAVAWERLEGRKRGIFDQALDDLDDAARDRVRQAVISAERLGAKSRFVYFAAGVSPSFFRTEAEGAKWPIRSADLERALKRAYDMRSSSVHSLEQLPQEVWMLGRGADTVAADDEPMLTLEGLARLTRHLLERYVERAPTGIDAEFDWRGSLPGRLEMRMAPKYWIWQDARFSHASVPSYFAGFTENLLDVFAGREDGVADIRGVLERIEQMLPGTADGDVKTMLAGIYALWHRTIRVEDQRLGAEDLLAEHSHVLEEPSIVSFVVGLLSNRAHQWSVDDWQALAVLRREQRQKRNHLRIAPALDMALQVIAAERLSEAGRVDQAKKLAAYAVEELPGDTRLLAWELGVVDGDAEIDLRALTLGLPLGSKADAEAASESDRADS